MRIHFNIMLSKQDLRCDVMAVSCGLPYVSLFMGVRVRTFMTLHIGHLFIKEEDILYLHIHSCFL
jgi:hypothetical protein